MQSSTRLSIARKDKKTTAGLFQSLSKRPTSCMQIRFKCRGVWMEMKPRESDTNILLCIQGVIRWKLWWSSPAERDRWPSDRSRIRSRTRCNRPLAKKVIRPGFNTRDDTTEILVWVDSNFFCFEEERSNCCREVLNLQKWSVNGNKIVNNKLKHGGAC